MMKKLLGCAIFSLGMGYTSLFSTDNQTQTLSPIVNDFDLPYRIQIEEANFSLPFGIHSNVSAVYDGKWLLFAGRTNGMHGFNADPYNFPAWKQNISVCVVDPVQGTSQFRNLTDAGSGLTQAQIDQLSVTSCQFYQKDNTIYMTGGYGIDTGTGDFTTKNILTAVNIPGLINWVESGGSAASNFRQIVDSTFQVTGGYMAKIKSNPTLLVFGQDFEGFYFDSTFNGVYTQQVRKFDINDDGTNLSVTILPSDPPSPGDPNYRRRDLNVLPIVKLENGELKEGLVALSGVFTDIGAGGIWTVPVEITADGTPNMADPNLPDTFKQGMNNYTSATLGLFSEATGDMYNLLFGGISYEEYKDGIFVLDPELPFINQVTTVKIDQDDQYTQYLMSDEYPFIPSPIIPEEPQRFGAGAVFLNAASVPAYDNGVLKFDQLKGCPLLAGYIVGGIQSYEANTSDEADSTASSRIFKVFLLPVPIYNGCRVYPITDNTFGSCSGSVILDCATLLSEIPFNSSTSLTIRSGGGIINTNGFDCILNGQIRGSGPLAKSGKGILSLTADSSNFAGQTVIEEGVLNITSTGKLGGDLVVHPHAILAGIGSVENLSNSGMVSPGYSPGTLFVTGGYVQNYNGIYFVEVDAASNDLLQVTGAATLNGVLKTEVLNNFKPPLGSTYTIINAAQILGRFNFLQTNITPTVLFEPIYLQNSVQIKVIRDYLNSNLSPSLTPNEIAIGGMLNRVAPTAAGDLNDVLNAIDGLTTNEQVAHVYDQLSPRTAAVQATLAISEATLQSRNLIRRMYLLRNGCNKIDTSGLCLETDQGCFSGENGEVEPDDCAANSPWGMFLTGKVLLGDQKHTRFQDSYHSTTAGLTAGVDYEFFNFLTTGVMLGYSYSNAHLDHRGGKLHDDEWSVGLYATGYYRQMWCDLLFNYSWNNYHIRRPIDFSNIHRHATSKPGGDNYTAYLGMGRDFSFCNWIFEPLVGLQYTHVTLDRYREHGADSLNLIVDKQQLWSLQGRAGGTINRRFDWCSYKIMPNFRAFYVYEFHDENHSVHSRLSEEVNSGFNISTGIPDKQFALLGAGISALIKENMMIYFDYDAEVWRENYFVQSLSGGVRVDF